MGLDIYISRIRKPELSGQEPYLEEGLMNQHVFVYPISEIQDDPCYKEPLPFMVQALVSRNKIDEEKIAEAFQLEKGSIYAYTYDQNSISFGGKKRSDGKSFLMTIPRDRIQREFLYQETEMCYLFSREDIRHWHGHGEVLDQLQEYVSDHFPSVENCGYYMLTEEHIQAMNQFLSETDQIPMETPTETEALFYQEWY